MSRFALSAVAVLAASVASQELQGIATSAETDAATSPVTTSPADEIPASLTCAEEQIVVGGCDPNDVETCAANCNLFQDDSKEPGYLLDKV